jgi:hypothetical protein
MGVIAREVHDNVVRGQRVERRDDLRFDRWIVGDDEHVDDAIDSHGRGATG